MQTCALLSVDSDSNSVTDATDSHWNRLSQIENTSSASEFGVRHAGLPKHTVTPSSDASSVAQLHDFYTKNVYLGGFATEQHPEARALPLASLVPQGVEIQRRLRPVPMRVPNNTPALSTCTNFSLSSQASEPKEVKTQGRVEVQEEGQQGSSGHPALLGRREESEDVVEGDGQEAKSVPVEREATICPPPPPLSPPPTNVKKVNFSAKLEVKKLKTSANVTVCSECSARHCSKAVRRVCQTFFLVSLLAGLALLASTALLHRPPHELVYIGALLSVVSCALLVIFCATSNINPQHLLQAFLQREIGYNYTHPDPFNPRKSSGRCDGCSAPCPCLLGNTSPTARNKSVRFGYPLTGNFENGKPTMGNPQHIPHTPHNGYCMHSPHPFHRQRQCYIPLSVPCCHAPRNWCNKQAPSTPVKSPTALVAWKPQLNALAMRNKSCGRCITSNSASFKRNTVFIQELVRQLTKQDETPDVEDRVNAAD